MKVKIKKRKKNPYPKYSYDTAIVAWDGSPVWGIDKRWLMFEIKQALSAFLYLLEIWVIFQ